MATLQSAIEVHAHSAFHSVNKTKSHLRIQLPGGQIVARPPVRMFCSLKSAQIPNSQYNIDFRNNKIDYALKNTQTNVVTNHTITLNSGNNNVKQVLNELKAKFSFDSQTPSPDNKDTIQYNADDVNTNKFTFKPYINGDAHEISFLFASGTNSAHSGHQVLGFATKEDTEFATELESADVVNVSGGQNIYCIRSDVLSTHSVGPNGQSDILAKIPVMGGAFAYTQYQPSTHTPMQLSAGDPGLTQIDLRLTNSASEELIDLNGQDWTASVLFEFDATPVNVEEKPHARQMLNSVQMSPKQYKELDEKRKNEELKQVALAKMQMWNDMAMETDFNFSRVGASTMPTFVGLEQATREANAQALDEPKKVEMLGQFGEGKTF